MRGAERNRSRRWSRRADEDVVRSIDDIVGVMLDVDIPAVLSILTPLSSVLLKRKKETSGTEFFFWSWRWDLLYIASYPAKHTVRILSSRDPRALGISTGLPSDPSDLVVIIPVASRTHVAERLGILYPLTL
jgi:hypothetical protein